VGGWFVDGERPTKRLSKMRSTSTRAGSECGAVEEEEGSVEKAGPGKPTKRRSSMKLLTLSALSLSGEAGEATVSRARSKKERDALPALRDLAILPTQRVMRYVLLYRGEFVFLFQLHCFFRATNPC
jgi:hypothetical protein